MTLIQEMLVLSLRHDFCYYGRHPRSVAVVNGVVAGREGERGGNTTRGNGFMQNAALTKIQVSAGLNVYGTAFV